MTDPTIIIFLTGGLFLGWSLGALAVPIGAPYAVIVTCFLFLIVIGFVTLNGPIRSIDGALTRNLTEDSTQSTQELNQ